MTSARPYLEELLILKKQQATVLFCPWDVEDEGRIAVKQLRPLLLSVFPESKAAAATPYLTLGRVKAAYEGVTHRPYQALSSVATATASSSQHARRPHDPMYAGPTLDELHRVIDVLASADEDKTVTAPSSTLMSKEPEAHDCPLSLSVSLTLRSFAAQEGKEGECDCGAAGAGSSRSSSLRKKHAATSVMETAGARLRLLRGSIEQMYHAFCAAGTEVGQPVPTQLPIDAAHLKRLAWTVKAQPLQLGESYALHQLFALASATAEARQKDEAAAVGHISQDAFVSLLCAL